MPRSRTIDVVDTPFLAGNHGRVGVADGFLVVTRGILCLGKQHHGASRQSHRNRQGEENESPLHSNQSLKRTAYQTTINRRLRRCSPKAKRAAKAQPRQPEYPPTAERERVSDRCCGASEPPAPGLHTARV